MTTRRDFLVTGTDTGVGKTLASVALMRAWRARGLAVAGMKPVASGAEPTAAGPRNDDALQLAAESSRDWPYLTVNPYTFVPPIAPHLAAAEAGVEIGMEPIRQAFSTLQAGSDLVVVEGAGGVLVPLGPGLSFAELAAALGLEVIVVVGLRLGCLNHALLTIEALERRGLPLAGWIGNHIDPGFERAGQNVEWLHGNLAPPCLGIIPYLASRDVASAAAALSPPTCSSLR